MTILDHMFKQSLMVTFLPETDFHDNVDNDPSDENDEFEYLAFSNRQKTNILFPSPLTSLQLPIPVPKISCASCTRTHPRGVCKATCTLEI